MQTLMPLAERIARRLTERRETVAIAESSTGGLVAAALVAIPGASAYFLGGAVIYTGASRAGLLGIQPSDLEGMRPSTEPYAALMAERMRARHGAVWALGETGATGPTGNRYGDAAGHCCIALAGPATRVATIETASADRQANMRRFALRALELLDKAIAAA
ncbi:MAG: CinA family protein [Alphaproteobacteria bacterium]|nr:CinA family protein [Alphaproteobacteria bacterium]